MSRKAALTADQVRANFRRQGTTVTQWAEARGYDRQAVYRVIGGRDRANFGRAHEIAVALGMKVPDDNADQVDSTIGQQPVAGRNAQPSKAA